MANIYKIQYHDLPAGGNSHRDVRGGLQSEDHWGGCYLPGASPAAYPMSGIRVEFTSRSMTSHCIQLHGMEPEIYWDRIPFNQIEPLLLVYKVIFPTTLQLCQCPFPGFPGTSGSRSFLSNHLSRIRWGDRILILEDHPTLFPHCERCSRQVPQWILNNFH